VFSKKRGLNRRPGPPVHDDMVERDFTAAGPNELWLTDITEHPTAEGKLYVCAVKDVYSVMIVGYSMPWTSRPYGPSRRPAGSWRGRRRGGEPVLLP
jgi:transposase InsO family protein